MRQIRETLRLHLQAGLSYSEVARALKISKSVVGQVRLAGPGGRRGLGAAQTLSDEELEARLYRPAVPRSSHQLAPDFGARAPGAQASRRHPDAAVGGVRHGQPAGLQVHELLHQVRRVRQAPAALDAPGPHRRREAVRRLRRRHRAHRRRRHRRDHPGPDLRGHARRVELHLRLRHAAPDHRRLDRRTGARAGVHRRRAPPDRARPDPRAHQDPRPLRPRAQPHLRGIRRHYGCAVLAARPAHPARQAQGRGLGAPGPALDPGAPAQPPLLQPGRAQHAPSPSCSIDLNNRPFKKLPGCRRSAFESLDAPALRPLPATALRHRPLEDAPRSTSTTTSSSRPTTTACRTGSSAPRSTCASPDSCWSASRPTSAWPATP